MDKVDLLTSLEAQPVKNTLTELAVTNCWHPQFSPATLVFLQQLPKLTKLHLCSSFNAPLDALTVQQLTPPSTLVPSLKAFSHVRPHIIG